MHPAISSSRPRGRPPAAGALAFVARSLPIVCSVTGLPSSSTAPRSGTLSDESKVAKSKRWASTKTLATMSPPPPGMPKGAL